MFWYFDILEFKYQSSKQVFLELMKTIKILIHHLLQEYS